MLKNVPALHYITARQSYANSALTSAVLLDYKEKTRVTEYLNLPAFSYDMRCTSGDLLDLTSACTPIMCDQSHDLPEGFSHSHPSPIYNNFQRAVAQQKMTAQLAMLSEWHICSLVNQRH